MADGDALVFVEGRGQYHTLSGYVVIYTEKGNNNVHVSDTTVKNMTLNSNIHPFCKLNKKLFTLYFCYTNR